MPKHSAPKKDSRLNANATEAEVVAFNAACASIEAEHPEIIRRLAAAFVRHVEKYGRIEFPIRLAEPGESRAKRS